jgi:TP901 family phage tail tape measure protein
MALIKDVRIGISVNTGPFAAGMKSAEAQLARFGTAASRIGGVLDKLNAGFAAAAVGRLAFEGLKSAVTTAAHVETAMAGLSKATDLEGTALGDLKGQITSLSTELKGVSLDDLLAIATSGAKLGVASGDLLEYTRGVAMLSTAMDDVPAEQIAEQVGKINVVFKLGVSGALRIGSAIDKLADSGVSSASGILDVTQRVSGMAAAMGLGADETVSLAAAASTTEADAYLAKAAYEERAMQDSVVELTLKLQEQIDTLGMSAAATEAYKLQVAGATEEQLKEVRALAAKKEALEKDAKLKEGVGDLTARLKEQVATFGLSADAAEVYRLRLAGASDQELATAISLSQQLNGMEEAKRIKDENASKGGPRFAAAALAGSSEAYSAQIRFAAMGEGRDEPMKKTAKATEKSADLLTQINAGIGKLVDKGLNAAGAAALELFAL